MHLSLEYIAVGLVVGFLSGMFGVGGSLITTPILKLVFGLSDIIALATPLPVVIPTAIAGVIGYRGKGLIHKKIAAASIIGGLPATILGAYITKFTSGKLLMVLTGIFLIIVAFKMLYGKKLKQSEKVNAKNILVYALGAGVFAGLLSGFLAIGGAIVLIPVYVLLFGMTMQETAATSLVCICFFAVPGSLVHWFLGHINPWIMLNLSLGVIPSSYLG